MIEIKGVSKKFKDKTIIHTLDLSVKKGEFYALIGPNGAGKSTLVKLLAGLLQPTKGEILLDGINVVTEPKEAKALIGYIPDEPTVWDGMTGLEFMHFVGALYNIPVAERERDIKKLLKIYNLSGTENQLYQDYSRGVRQKYSILAALLHNPKILLIDEPIVGLDPISIDITKNILDVFVSEGGTVLMVTHTLFVAQELATKIGIFEKGKLKIEGTYKELVDKANLPTKTSLDDVYKNYLAK
ncbi:MAG: ABC transporter ATP-binding protein [Candidatus Paceibacterota bacterium]